MRVPTYGGKFSTCTSQPQNYRWQNRKEYKEKTNSAQSVLAGLFWLLYWPGSTHRPHMDPTPGRAWGMRVRQGSTSPALPLDFTPTQSGCCTGPATPTDHPPFVSISCLGLLRHSSLRHGNPTLRKRWRTHCTFLFCHLWLCGRSQLTCTINAHFYTLCTLTVETNIVFFYFCLV